jgi:hypothetical protein
MKFILAFLVFSLYFAGVLGVFGEGKLSGMDKKRDEEMAGRKSKSTTLMSYLESNSAESKEKSAGKAADPKASH